VYVGVSRREPKSVEGFGISLAEAAACGKPVVGGRSGGVPETVREGETGLLVDPTNHHEVAAAIDAILSDESRAQSLGRAGRELVERHFNWTRVTRDVIAIGQEFGLPAGQAAVRRVVPSARPA
jgi:phosphatidylinositol alpha-1,6-mannosyltransferase